MALQDNWRDLIDHESLVQANDINSIANAVIALERAKADGTIINKEAVVNALDYTPADEEAVRNELGTETLETEAQTVKGAINELKRTSSLTKIINNASGEMITLKDATNDYYEAIKIYGKSTQDGTPTPEAPVPIVSVGDDGTATVTSCGKNLFDINKALVEFQIVGDEYRITNRISAFYKIPFAENTQYTLSAYVKNSPTLGNGRFRVYYTDGTFEEALLSNKTEYQYLTHTTSASKTIDYIGTSFGGSGYFVIKNGELQIELGSTATPYEPYKGTTATLTTALPLCSVGDVRDEVIFNADGTGKVIKKAHKINSYAGEPIDSAFMSSTGELSEGATVVYALATPEEISLTGTEVMALKSLMSYRGTTNVYNDSGSEMEIEYTADMKAYIDSILGVGG